MQRTAAPHPAVFVFSPAPAQAPAQNMRVMVEELAQQTMLRIT
jgi:hypothetical protein